MGKRPLREGVEAASVFAKGAGLYEPHLIMSGQPVRIDGIGGKTHEAFERTNRTYVVFPRCHRVRRLFYQALQ
jgi:hypothetical protein